MPVIDVRRIATILESLSHLVEGTLPIVPTHVFAERLLVARELPELRKFRLPAEALDTLATWADNLDEPRRSLGASRQPLTKHGLIQSARMETQSGGWYSGDKLTPEGRKIVELMIPVVYAPISKEELDTPHQARMERQKAAWAQLKKKLKEDLVSRLNKLVEAKKEKFPRDTLADITTQLGSSSERDRFVAKFDQVWELADQDGVALTDFEPADVASLQDAIVLADKVAQQATREHTPHAREIRRFATELKDIAKRRTRVPGEL